MGKFININTKIPPLQIRGRSGFYAFPSSSKDTPKKILTDP